MSRCPGTLRSGYPDAGASSAVWMSSLLRRTADPREDATPLARHPTGGRGRHGGTTLGCRDAHRPSSLLGPWMPLLPVSARAQHTTHELSFLHTRFDDPNLQCNPSSPPDPHRKDPEVGGRARPRGAGGARRRRLRPLRIEYNNFITFYVLRRLRALRFTSRFISSSSRTALRRVPRMPLSAPAILQGPAWCHTWKPPVAYAHQPFRVLATRRPPICYCGS